MVVTSVAGHLMELEFVDPYRSWGGCDPLDLFHAPLQKTVDKNKDIAKNLKQEAKKFYFSSIVLSLIFIFFVNIYIYIYFFFSLSLSFFLSFSLSLSLTFSLSLFLFLLLSLFLSFSFSFFLFI